MDVVAIVQPSCTVQSCAKAYTAASMFQWLVSQIDMANAALGRTPVSLVSHQNGNCVDLPWGAYANPGAVNQFPCGATSTDQMWFAIPASGPPGHDWVQFVSVATGECLSAPGGWVQQVRCSPSDSHQIWDRFYMNAYNTYELRPQLPSGTTLDMPLPDGGPSTPLQTHSINNGANQEWGFTARLL
jgi:hypothetical protein